MPHLSSLHLLLGTRHLYDKMKKSRKDNIYTYLPGTLAIYVAMSVAIKGILAKVVNGCKWM